MKIKITVKENRQMICSKYIIGTIGENNVTTLSFSFPEEIRDWQHYFVAEIKGDSYVLPIENETLLLPAYVLTANCFKAQIVATKDSGEKWRSSPCRFMLFPRINDSGKNPAEECRLKLAAAMSKSLGGDFSKATFDEMIEHLGTSGVLNAGEVTVDDVSLNDRTILPPEGRNAISKVTVKALRPNTLKVTSNGHYPDIIPGENPDGTAAPPEYWTAVDADVPNEINLTDFSVNPAKKNKTYTFVDSDQITTDGKAFNGIGKITVEAVDATIDENIKPENIRKGINILGVEGSYEANKEE